jgi:2-haloacid dehalogenase
MKREALIRLLALQLCIVVGCVVLNGQSHADVHIPPRFQAIAFDYFVIFDPNSVVPEVEKTFPGKGAEFTARWRAKQFEYGFLRSITNRHADFLRLPRTPWCIPPMR